MYKNNMNLNIDHLLFDILRIYIPRVQRYWFAHIFSKFVGIVIGVGIFIFINFKYKFSENVTLHTYIFNNT